MVHYSVFLGSVVGKRKKKRKGRKGEVGGTKGVRMIGRSVFHRVHKEQTARRGWILKAYRLEFNKENPPLEIDNRNAGIILLLHSALPVVLLGKKKKKRRKRKEIVRNVIQSRVVHHLDDEELVLQLFEIRIKFQEISRWWFIHWNLGIQHMEKWRI